MSDTAATDADKPAAWHVQREIPLALLVGLLAQLAAFIWWGSSMAGRLAYGEARIAALEQSQAAGLSEIRRLSEQLARTDERIIALTAMLQSAIQRLPRPRVGGTD